MLHTSLELQHQQIPVIGVLRLATQSIPAAVPGNFTKTWTETSYKKFPPTIHHASLIIGRVWTRARNRRSSRMFTDPFVFGPKTILWHCLQNSKNLGANNLQGGAQSSDTVTKNCVRWGHSMTSAGEGRSGVTAKHQRWAHTKGSEPAWLRLSRPGSLRVDLSGNLVGGGENANTDIKKMKCKKCKQMHWFFCKIKSMTFSPSFCWKNIFFPISLICLQKNCYFWCHRINLSILRGNETYYWFFNGRSEPNAVNARWERILQIENVKM